MAKPANKPTIAMPTPAAKELFVGAGKEPTKRLTIDISLDLHRAFKIAATQSDRDMKDIMSDMIQNYVDGKR